jgi:hypothetical protein
MAVTCDWALLCEQAYFDPQQSRSLNLSRIIEQVVVDAVPSTIGPIVIVAHLDGYGESRRVSLRATRQDGAVAVNDQHMVAFEHVGPYLLFTISRLEVPTEGRYRFDIIFDDAHVARTVWLTIMPVSHDAVDVVH